MRPHPDHDASARTDRIANALRNLGSGVVERRAVGNSETDTVGVGDVGVEDVHRRLADEGRDEQIGGPVLEFQLWCELLQTRRPP